MNEREEQLNTSRGISRRDFLRLGRDGLILGGIVLAAKVCVDSRNAYLAGQNNAARLAAQLYRTADESHFVHDISVVGEDIGSGKIAAYARSKPKTEASNDDISAGTRVAELRVGSTINRALVVWGGDRSKPQDKNAQEKWLAFPEGGRMVFAYSWLFEQTRELADVEPVYLNSSDAKQASVR